MDTQAANTMQQDITKQHTPSSEPSRLPKFSSYVDYLLEKINPSFQIINSQYSEALNILNKQRISKLLDTPSLSFANLYHKQLSFINHVRKNINSLQFVYSGINTTVQQQFRQPQSEQNQKSVKQIALSSQSNLNLDALIKNINKSCQNQISLDSSSKQQQIQYPDIENEYVRTLIQIHLPTNIKIKDQYYQTLPQQVDYSEITQLVLGGLGKDLSQTLIKHFINLTKLHIKIVSQIFNANYASSYSPLQSNNCESPDFRIIMNLSHLKHLQQLRIDNWTTLYIDQYPVIWSLFPKIKTLFISSQFILNTVLIDVFRKNRNIQNITIIDNTGPSYSSFRVTPQILLFLNKSIPNLKRFQSSKIRLQQNYHSSIGQLQNLEQLCIYVENIEQDMPRSNAGFSNFGQYENSRQSEIKSQKNFHSLIVNLKAIKKFHYTGADISSKSLEQLHLKLPNIQDLQLKTDGTLDLNKLHILSKFNNLKKLYLTTFDINSQGWDILAKAKFQLNTFHLVSSLSSRYYTTYRAGFNGNQQQEDQINFSKASTKFFQNQASLQQLKIKQQGNNVFYYNIHQLRKLKTIQVEIQVLLGPSTSITEIAFVYLSKLREVQSFSASENQYQNPLLSQSFFRFVRNNPKMKLKPVPNNKLSYKVQRNMYLLNKGASYPQIPAKSYYNTGYNNYYTAGSFNFNGGNLTRNPLIL